MKKYLFLLLCIGSVISLYAQNVGIGTLLPLAKMHIQGSADISQLLIDANVTQTNANPLVRFRKSTGEDLMWLHSDDTSNVFLGLKAGRVNIIGPQGVNNTFIGSRVGYSNTNGRDNTALGTNALLSNTKGSQNTAIGTSALFSQSFSPGGAFYLTNNVAIGFESLYTNQPISGTSGVNNTAVGMSSMRSNTIGASNTATGAFALYLNTTGNSNTAIGYTALNSNTTGGENTAVGKGALFTQYYFNGGNVWVGANVAIGFEALFLSQPSTASDGRYNTAIGHTSLRNNSTGHHNTCVGYQSMILNTTGYNNTVMGVAALSNNSSGHYNAVFGNVALISNTTGSDNTAVGGSTLSSNTTGGSNTAIGGDALGFLVGGTANIALGRASGTALGSPNVNNTISIGNDGYLNAASNQAFIGNLSTAWIGGQTTWFTYASDARVKNNVKEDVQGLSFIERLRPVTYNLNITAMLQITGNKETEDYPEKYDVEKIKQSGFLAQEVEKAAIASGYNFSGITIPKNENELYTMSYAQFVVPLVKAVQELSSKNNAQDIIIENMKAENAILVARIEKIEKLLGE